MDRLLPSEHRFGDRSVCPARVVSLFPAGLAGVPSGHDDLDRAVDTHEEHWEPSQAPGSVRQHLEGPGVGIVVPDIDCDVEPEAGMSGDRLVQSVVEDRNNRFDRGKLTAGAQTRSSAGSAPG